MKAAVYPNYGSPEVIKIADLPDPKPKSGEVIVRVEYAAINPIDWKIGAGKLSTVFDSAFPLAVGRDAAGTGERFCALLPRPGGALAEFVSVPTDLVARVASRLRKSIKHKINRIYFR